jgi:ECF sigma factor
MRIFLELTLKEIADVLGVFTDTAESDWAFAWSWLKREWGKHSK